MKGCEYCYKAEAFIGAYCFDCLMKAQESSGLPFETLIAMIKEGLVLV